MTPGALMQAVAKGTGEAASMATVRLAAFAVLDGKRTKHTS